jgi:hypothetical protein
LELLIAEGHVVKHDEKVEFVPPTQLEVHHVHDTVGLLQEVKSLLPLLTLDKLDR